jgi:hypothetical protein
MVFLKIKNPLEIQEVLKYSHEKQKLSPDRRVNYLIKLF